MRVDLLEMQVRGNFAVVQRKDDLDQPGNSGSRLQVADVGLHRADQARLFFRPPLHHFGERLHLDGVAQNRASAVRLHVVHILGTHAGVRQRSANHFLLGQTVWCGEAVASAVLIHGRTPNDRQNVVVVAHSVGQTFQDHDTAAFAAHVAVGGGIEGFAAALRRHHPGVRERDRQLRRKNQVHTADNRQIRLVVAQAPRSQVHRHQ